MIRLRAVIVALFLAIMMACVVPCIGCLAVSDPDDAHVAVFDDLSKWMSGSGDFDLVEDSMTLKGDTGCAYYDKELDRDTLVEFDAMIGFGDEKDSWVAFKFRAEHPYGQVWESGETYYFLIRYDEIIGGRVTGGSPPTALITKDNNCIRDGLPHRILAGVVNIGDNETPRLILKIDGKTVIEYDDFDAGDLFKNQKSVFSVNVFHNAQICIKTPPGTGSVLFEEIQRPLPVTRYNKLDSYGDKWSVAQYTGYSDEQYYDTVLKRGTDGFTLAGLGSIVYKDCINYSVIRFDVRMTTTDNAIRDDDILILLNKGVRDTYYGRYGYGLRINHMGRIGLVTFEDDKDRSYPGFETGYDFTGTQCITAEVVEHDGRLAVYIHLNDDATAFMYDIPFAPPENPEVRFYGVINRDPYMSVELSGVKFAGHIDGYQSDDDVKPLYMQDCFMADGARLIHWDYREDQSSCLKVVLEDGDGGLVGEVFYPGNTFLLPAGFDNDRLYLTAVNPDGKQSEKVEVILKDVHSAQYTGNSGQDRIGIRSNAHGAQFYHTSTGEEFIINGVNYIRLRFGDHSNFEPANGLIPSEYDPYSAETMFRLLKSNGFNTVRVFIASGGTGYNLGTGGPVGTGPSLASGYMDNVVDFLRKAQKYGIYVMVNFGENDLPDNPYFKTFSGISNPQDILFSGRGLEAKLKYVGMFMDYIKARDKSLLKTLLAIESRNEFRFYADQEPFTATDGKYVFYANGKSYDMSDPDSRRDLANAALKNYYKRLKQTMKSIDPDSLLAEGTSTLRYIGLSFPRDKGIYPGIGDHSPMSAIEYLSTDIDFLDIHSYQMESELLSAKENVAADISSMLMDTPECIRLMREKPVVMCEYGSFRNMQQSFDEAKEFILGQRNAALESGYKGVMLWSFDSFAQTGMYSAMEDNGRFLKELGSTDHIIAGIVPENYVNEDFTGIVIFVSIFTVFMAAGVLFMRKYRMAYGKADADHDTDMDTDTGTDTDMDMNADTDTGTDTETGVDSDLQVFPAGSASVKGDAGVDKSLEGKVGQMAAYPFVCNVFGDFVVSYKGESIRQKVFPSIKARDLLIYLLDKNRAVGRDEIIADLWQDKTSANHDDLFHATLHILRKSLKAINPSYKYIVCYNKSYSIEKNAIFCTRELFCKDLEKLLHKEHLSYEEVNVIEKIVAQYNGDYLHLLDYEWAGADREYYHKIYEKAVLRICRHYIYNCEESESLGYLYRLLKFDPYSEDAYMLLFEAYSRQKDHASVKRLYANYLDIAKELGIKPSESITRLFREATDTSRA